MTIQPHFFRIVFTPYYDGSGGLRSAFSSWLYIVSALYTIQHVMAGKIFTVGFPEDWKSCLHEDNSFINLEIGLWKKTFTDFVKQLFWKDKIVHFQAWFRHSLPTYCFISRLSEEGQRWTETNVSDLRGERERKGGKEAGCPVGVQPYNCHTKVGLSEKGNKWNWEVGEIPPGNSCFLCFHFVYI